MKNIMKKLVLVFALAVALIGCGPSKEDKITAVKSVVMLESKSNYYTVENVANALLLGRQYIMTHNENQVDRFANTANKLYDDAVLGYFEYDFLSYYYNLYQQDGVHNADEVLAANPITWEVVKDDQLGEAVKIGMDGLSWLIPFEIADGMVYVGFAQSVVDIGYGKFIERYGYIEAGIEEILPLGVLIETIRASIGDVVETVETNE